MTHTVIQSPAMTPEEFAADRSTHVRAADGFLDVGGGVDTARILERKINDRGEVPVQFDDGSYGSVPVADIGDTLEMFTPLHDLPPALWFTRAHHGEYSLSLYGLGPTLPTGLRFGPYTDEQRHRMLTDSEEGMNWAWVKYTPEVAA